MGTEGIDNIRAILRRSRGVLVVLVIVGALSMNVLRHLEGPLYTAHAQVILSPTDLASAIAGLSSYVDPTAVSQTESSLASSPELYVSAAQRHPRVGSAAELETSTSSNLTGSVITFSASSPTAEKAVAYANAVAATYPVWRAAVSSATLSKAISQLRAQIAHSSTGRADLQSQLNRLRLLRTVNSGNVLLVEPAQGAVKTRPSPVKDSLLGGLIGLFVALLVIGGRELLDNRVRSEQEIEEVLGIPVVSTIQRLPRNLTPLVFVSRDFERYGDMYALLAAGVARMREGKDRVVIAVTSAAAGEGKTTTAVNLAAALARREERVRLVDLDTRRPSIGRVFSIPKDAPGVDRAIRNEADVETLFWDILGNGIAHAPRSYGRGATRAAVSESASSLQVLPMGAVGSTDASTRVERVTELIESVAEQAEYVVVDTPPALLLPNMSELAEVVDVVLVVVRHGRTSRRSLESLRRLQRTWADVEVRAVLVDKPAYGDSYAYSRN